MANFTPKEIDLTSINKGERFDNGNIVPVESINAPIEASAYAQELSKMAMASAEQSKNRVDILETQIIQKQGTAIYVNGIAQSRVNVTSDPQTQLNALSSKSTEQDNRLATIESKNTAQDNKIKAIETKNTEQDNTINTKASKLTKLWNGNLANGADTSITISNADKYKAFLLKGNAFGIFTMVIHNSSAAFSSAYINSEKGVTGITITLASDGKLSWGQCGFYSNGTFSFQDRTGTGYYSLWEVWGIE